MRELWHVLLFTGSTNEHLLFAVVAENKDIALDAAIREAIRLEPSTTVREMTAYRCGDVVLIGKWPMFEKA